MNTNEFYGRFLEFHVTPYGTVLWYVCFVSFVILLCSHYNLNLNDPIHQNEKHNYCTYMTTKLKIKLIPIPTYTAPAVILSLESK